jgi:hypothetical protein
MAHFEECDYSGVILTGPTVRQKISCDSPATTEGENDRQLAGPHGHGFRLSETPGIAQPRHGGE